MLAVEGGLRVFCGEGELFGGGLEGGCGGLVFAALGKDGEGVGVVACVGTAGRTTKVGEVVE